MLKINYDNQIDYIIELLRDSRNTDDSYSELSLMIDLENTYIKRAESNLRIMKKSPFSDKFTKSVIDLCKEEIKQHKESIKEIKEEMKKLGEN